MNVNNILKNYGFKNGVFKRSANPVNKLDFNAQMKYGALEKTVTIDTPAEFLTAAYYSPIKISYKAQTAINSELPKGKTGAMRLASMWLTKMAENPEKAAKYKKALDIIMKKSGVNKYQIAKYYAKSMERKIYAMPLGEPLTPTEQNKVKNLLLAYMVKPTKANARAFKSYKFKLGMNLAEKSGTITAFVKKVSPKVNIQLA